MQTPAEKHLIRTLKSFLCEHHKRNCDTPKILNIGAGRSVVIENQLASSGFPFVCDRADIENFQIREHYVGDYYQCSVEAMHQIKSKEYDAVFSNYLLEHVQDLNKAASEIYRILKPAGIFVASIPNPTAPEFLLAKYTPLWFHKIIRGKEAWETHYAFKNIKALRTIFQKAGFETIAVFVWSFMEGYLERFVILNKLARLYDKFLDIVQIKRFMNNACVVFKKPENFS